MAQLRIQMFGSFQVWQNDQLITDFRSDKVRALLAYLVVERAYPVSRTVLLDLLWPGYTASSARSSLRVALSNLRQLLADMPVLEVTRQTVQFIGKEGMVWCDAWGREAPLTQRPFLENLTAVDSSPFQQWRLETADRLQTLNHFHLHNLPRQRTPFFGRQAQLQLLTQTLLHPDYPLVTLVGQGGVGKTRLATQLAHQLLPHFADGVWFVPLAGLVGEDAEETAVEDRLIEAVIQAMGVPLSGQLPPKKQLLYNLRSRHCLLLFDNFEHLLAGAALLIDIVDQAPNVQLLVTSRVALNFQAEYVFPVAGLPVPESDDVAIVAAAESVRLFVERAERTGGGFVLNDATSRNVARICQFVAGLPLGIELAAAWTRSLSVAEIWQAVQTDLDFMGTVMRDVPERQQSMRVVIQHSWQMLSPAAQVALAQASVFRGGFSLAAAESILGADLPVLTVLLSHFLLEQDENGRFQMHELVRQFVTEKLSVAEKTAVAKRHTVYYLSTLAEYEATFNSEHQPKILKAIERDIDNIRCAWQWAIMHGQLQQCLACLNVLSLFYSLRGLSRDGLIVFQTAVQHLQTVYHASPRIPADAAILIGRLLTAQAAHHNYLGQYQQGVALSKQTIEFIQALPEPDIACRQTLIAAQYEWATGLREQGKFKRAHRLFAQIQTQADVLDLRWQARVAAGMGINYGCQSQFTLAQSQFDQALALYQQLNDSAGEAATLFSLGFVANQQGHFEKTTLLYQKSLAICEKLEMWPYQGKLLNGLGMDAGARGDYVQSQNYYQRAKEIADKTCDRQYAGLTRQNLGLTAVRLGDYETGKHYYEEALAIYREIHFARGEAWTLNNLGLLYQDLNDYGAALTCHEASLAMAQSLGIKTNEALAFCRLGQAWAGLNQTNKADDFFVQSFALHEELGETHWAMEALAGRLRLAVKYGDTASIKVWVEEILLYLQTKGAIRMREPLRIYLTCYEALEAVADERTVLWLETTYNLLQTWANKIENKATRLSFLTNVPSHNRIMTLWHVHQEETDNKAER